MLSSGFCAACSPARTRPSSAAIAPSCATDILSRLQEHLGTIADADAFELVYEELLDCLDGDDPRAFGLESRRQATRTERERALEALRSLWKDPEQRYRERLAASISAAVGSLSPKPE